MTAIAWNSATAAHLLRRAAFGGTPDEVDRCVRDGLDFTVDRLLDYASVSTQSLDDRLAAAQLDLTTSTGIIQWWLMRMRYSDRPLEERMTLVWHNHWATAISKVKSAPLMLQQNNLLRQYATGNFAALARAISRDPAMLIWLDNFSSRKEHPNENYGREFLELFTLGHGNYTEADVQASARSFTGFSLTRTDPPTYLYRSTYHDDGTKTFLGHTGNWGGDDIVGFACATHAHGIWIARRLFSSLVYDDPEDAVLEPFAQIYLDSGNELRPVIRAILTSPEMYSSRAMWQRVKSPVDHLVISARVAAIDASWRPAINALSTQGEVLFNPPDVGGWPYGLDWINSGALLSRMNLADTLATSFDPVAFHRGHTFASAAEMVDYYLAAFALSIDSAARQSLIAYVSPDPSTRSRGLLHLVLSLPEWQLN